MQPNLKPNLNLNFHPNLNPNFVWAIASVTPSNASTSRVAIVMEKSRPALHGWCSRKEPLLMIFAQDQTARSLTIFVLLYDIFMTFRRVRHAAAGHSRAGQGVSADYS